MKTEKEIADALAAIAEATQAGKDAGWALHHARKRWRAAAEVLKDTPHRLHCDFNDVVS